MAKVQNKRITINDIAELAGVAKSTVSEVIRGNPRGRVNVKTKERIREVIARCGYVPSLAAQTLNTRKTRQLGYLVSSTATLGLANNFYAEVLAGIESVCNINHYHCVVGKYDFSPSVHEFVLDSTLRQRSVDALIIAGITPDESCVESAGFRHFYLKPLFLKQFDQIDCSYRSISGMICSSWKREREKVLWQYTIPCGSSAAVLLPDGTVLEEQSGNYKKEIILK